MEKVEMNPVVAFRLQRRTTIAGKRSTITDHGGEPLRNIQREVRTQIVGVIPIADQVSPIVIITPTRSLQTGIVPLGIIIPTVHPGVLLSTTVVQEAVHHQEVREVVEGREERIDILA
jgi:hypothetical protein